MKIRNKLFKKGIIVAPLILMNISSTVNCQMIMSFNDCLAFAFEHNLQVLSSVLDIEKQENILQQQWNNLLPQFSANSSYSVNNGRYVSEFTDQIIETSSFSNNYGFSGSMTLFNGWQRKYQIDLQRYNLMLTENQHDLLKNQLSIQILETYTGCLLFRGLVEIQTEQFAISELELEKTNKLIALGREAGSTVYDIKAQLSSEKLLLIQYTNQYNLLVNKLKQFMHFPLDSEVIIALENDSIAHLCHFNDSLITDPEKSMQNSPVILYCKNELSIYNKQLQISKAGRSPSLRTYMGWSTGFYETALDSTNLLIPFQNQFDLNQRLQYGITMSIPIFTAFNRRTEIQQTKILIKQAQYKLDEELNTMKYEINKCNMEVQAALSQLEAANAHLESTEIAFKSASLKKDKGLISILDYYDSKAILGQSKIEVLRAELEVFSNFETLRFLKSGRFYKN